jgi:hypothetical protein
MHFGGRQLLLRLRVARTILYCQAAVMILIAAFALEILVIGGAGTGFPLSGVVDKQTLTGSGVTALALALIGIGFVLIVIEQQVTSRGARARLMLVAAEIAFAVYLIGWVANSVGTWLFGPACGAAVLILHYWPELHSYFFAADAVAPVPDPAPSPATPGTDGGSEPPVGVEPPSSDAPPSGT